MLTAQQIRDIAAMHDIEVTNHWHAISVGNEPPTLSRMSLVFTREAPAALEVLKSSPKEVAISISNAFQATHRPLPAPALNRTDGLTAMNTCCAELAHAD